jgi:hypothetical protein
MAAPGRVLAAVYLESGKYSRHCARFSIHNRGLFKHRIALVFGYRKIPLSQGDSKTVQPVAMIRISEDFWTRVWSSIFRPRFDRRLPYGADEAGAQATAQSERIKA